MSGFLAQNKMNIINAFQNIYMAFSAEARKEAFCLRRLGQITIQLRSARIHYENTQFALAVKASVIHYLE